MTTAPSFPSDPAAGDDGPRTDRSAYPAAGHLSRINEGVSAEIELDADTIEVDPVSTLINNDRGESFGDVREKAEAFGSKLKSDMPFFGSRPYDPVTRNSGQKVPHGERVEKCYRKMVDEVNRVRSDEADEWTVERSSRPRFGGPNDIGNTCGNYSKICPHHARLEVSRLIERYREALAEKIEDSYLYYMVISPPNVPSGHLETGRENNWNVWNKLRRRKYLDERLEGAIASEEVTVNETNGSWNHHINLIIASDYLDFSRINEDYREIVINEYQDERPSLEKPALPEIDCISKPLNSMNFSDEDGEHMAIKAALERVGESLQETLKYSAKFDSSEKDDDGLGMLDWDRYHLREFVRVFWGQRTTRSYGEWYGLTEEETDPPQTVPLASLYSSWDREQGVYILDLIQVHNSTSIEELAAGLECDPELLRENLRERDPPPPCEQEYNWNQPDVIPEKSEIGRECVK